MKLILSTVVGHLLALAAAQDSLIPVPAGFQPSAVTVTNMVEAASPSPSVLAKPGFGALVMPPDNAKDTPLSQCGPSITCQKKPELIEVTTIYPGTVYATTNTTTVRNTTVTNTFVDMRVTVTTSIVAHEGICTTVQEVTAKENLTIPVVQIITRTDWYLNWTTVVDPQTITVNVTERHACTSSMPRLPRLPEVTIMAHDQSPVGGNKEEAEEHEN